MVLPERFELSTSPLPRECSTPELRQHLLVASDRAGRFRPGVRGTQAVFRVPAQFLGHSLATLAGQRRQGWAIAAGMSKKSTPSASEQTREERLRAALRANLQRRKAQARSRADDGEEQQTGPKTGQQEA